jgi:hypothetical protein
MPETSIPVEHLLTITAATETAGLIANGPQGTRVIVGVTGGSFEGPRLKGTVKGPGGDWVTLRTDGSGRLDVRLLLETDDGALILMQYHGVFTDGATRIRSAPLFETGDERYAWLNNVQAIGLGSVGDGDVKYDVYQVL